MVDAQLDRYVERIMAGATRHKLLVN